MANDSPDQIAHHEFGHALRGYDQREVRAYLDAVAAQISLLQSEAAELRGRIGEMDDQALEDHIDTTAAEVANVLHTARLAAQSLQARTGEEIEAARTAAAETIGNSLRSAEADAYRLRKAAWETSSQMLDQVRQAARAGRKQADKDTLGIIGEAERSAHRKVSDAKREAENRARVSRLEAEKVLSEARARRNEMLDEVERATDASQERVKALERRRDELMRDLESIRADTLAASKDESVAGEDFTSATVKVVPGYTAEPEPVRKDSEDVRVIPATQARWADGSDTVRLIPPSSTPIEPPLSPDFDADALVDELTGGRNLAEGSIDEPELLIGDAGGPIDDAGGDVDQDDGADDHGEAAADRTDGSDDEQSDGASSPQIKDESGAHDTPLIADSGGEVPVIRPEIPAPSAREHDSDELGTLFDLLRDPNGVKPKPEPSIATGDEVSEETAVEDLITPEPPDPLEGRDRALLPVMNRALRAVKRALSEIQNGQMERLKADVAGFESDAAPLAALVDPELLILVREAHVAGVEAASILAGVDELDRNSIDRPVEIDVGFAADANEAVVAAIEAEQAAGGGVGEVTAAVSKIYRVWRADEAERRVRSLAYQHFHAGMVAGLTAAGSSNASIVVVGAGCDICTAAAGVSAIADLDSLPPFHDDCRCLVAPA